MRKVEEVGEGVICREIKIQYSQYLSLGFNNFRFGVPVVLSLGQVHLVQLANVSC